MLINGEERTFGLNEIYTLNRDNYTHVFKIVGIDDYVDIEYERRGSDDIKVRKQRFTSRNDQVALNGINVKLIRINANKQVKLVVLSKGYGPRVESNFKFRIGIEKRAIKLSPERTKEIMNNLKESIKFWEDANRKLGNVVRGLKGACFATSAVLTTKNIVTGASGISLARNLIMVNSGGWNEKCEELVSKREFETVHQCLLAHKEEIEKDVNLFSDKIKETNGVIKGIQDKIGVKDGIFNKNIDTKKVEEEYKKVFDEWCRKNNEEIKLPNQDKTTVVIGSSDKSICNWATLTHEQRRDIMTYFNARSAGGSEVLINMTHRELGKVLLEAKKYNDEYSDLINSNNEANKFNLGIKTTDSIGDSVTQGYIKRISIEDLNHNVYKNFKENDKVVRIFIPKEKVVGGEVKWVINDSRIAKEIGGKQVIVEVVYSEKDNYYYPKENGKVFLVDGTTVSQEAAEEVRRYMNLAGLDKIKLSDKKAYQNRMLNPENLRVKYFEKAPYKGLPSEIPFDIENGWYVELTYIISGFGKPYDESGRVINYYICNVGSNGLIEFKKNADDICRYYNEHNPDISFPGLTLEESRNLIEQAKRAILEAAKHYGKQRVSINGKTFETGKTFGGEEGKCTDFMSIDDCTLLFNVCDPVICPASRCDFGGRYRVDNVIQSGVAGSLLLCLPNYKEGVVVPICLSGVHAGIQGYTSILNSTVDCLNESLQTGRNVGICDEIKSIYICEFFWRQAAPLAELAVPRLFESITGQARGGGEYLTIRSAWDNTQNAMSYFAEVYAINSVKAFSNRNIDYAGGEFGTDICRSFISTNYGGIKGFFRALIEPDSPVQYHAWFSESPLTTATLPPSSHYKVYYHIYAGRDIGAYYVVYLKDIPQISGINTFGYFVVDRGYITRGDRIDRARDFIAASGFKQLCVNINGKDECGFGKVSTSYALNSLAESYVADQITTGITSEKECIAGTPSFGSLINPNLQAGLSEVINPQLYNEGIIRICATDNPGRQVLPSGDYDRTNSSFSRWQIVGYCDDSSIKCWLDTQSVKEVIRDKGLENEILENVNTSNIDSGNYWTYEQSRSVADKSEKFIANLKIVKEDTRESIIAKISETVTELRKLSELGITNIHRARAHYLLGRLYKKVSEELWKGKTNQSNVIIYDDITIEEEKVGEIFKDEKEIIGNTLEDKGFSIVNNKIIDKNGDTGFYLEKVDKKIYDQEKNLIEYYVKSNTFEELNVGKVVNKKILFTIPSSQWTEIMYELDSLSIVNNINIEIDEERDNENKDNNNGEKSEIRYKINNEFKIIDRNSEYIGYYIRKSSYNEADVYYLYESNFLFDRRIGELINKIVVISVPSKEWSETMNKLNGLSMVRNEGDSDYKYVLKVSV